MAQGQSTNQTVVTGAKQALNQFKYEVASEIGLNVRPGDYWGDLSSRQCGTVGGHITRRLIEMAERQLAGGQR